MIPATATTVAKRLYGDARNATERAAVFAIVLEHVIDDDTFENPAKVRKQIRKVLGVEKLKTGAGDTIEEMIERLKNGRAAHPSGNTTNWKENRTLEELTWGRFPPDRIYNVDQVPLPFVVGCDTTWDNKGADRVWIRQYGSGLDKRQATTQLTISPGSIRIRTALIFHGKSNDYYENRRPKGYVADPDAGFPDDITCEADLWADDIAVHFNDNAWATPGYSRAWPEEVLCEDVNTDKENILFADNLGGQGSTKAGAEFKKIMKEQGNTLVWNLPRNCTDEVQPIDAGFLRLKVVHLHRYSSAFPHTRTRTAFPSAM